MRIKQKSDNRPLIIPVLLFFLAFFVNAEGEKKDTPPAEPTSKTLHYIDGNLAEDFLPYYKKFSIKGSIKLPGNKEADAVQLIIKLSPAKINKLSKKIYRSAKKIIWLTQNEDKSSLEIRTLSRKIMEITRDNVINKTFDDFIKELNAKALRLSELSLNNQERRIRRLSEKIYRRSKKIKKLYLKCKEVGTSKWTRKDKEKEFLLLVNPLTGWGKNYLLTFIFYKKPDKNDPIVKEIITAAVNELEKTFRDAKELTQKDAKDELLNALNSTISKKEDTGEIITIHKKKYEDKIKKLSKLVMDVTVDSEKLSKAKSKLNTLNNDLEKIDAQSLESLFDELKDAYTKNLKPKIKKEDFFKNLYNAADLKLLSDLAGNPGKIIKPKEKPEEITKKKEFIKKFKKIQTAAEWDKYVKKKFSIKSKLTLATITNTLPQYLTVFNEIENEIKENMKQLKSGLDPLLPGYLLEIGQAVSFSNVAWPENKTELDRIRFGTSYGIGGAALSLGKETDTEFDAFSFVGLKYYWGPVDKRRPNPFLERFSRWSLTLSVVFNSDIKYKDQKQTDLLGGVMPMLGIAFDISSDFALNLGTIFFRQPSINPLAGKKGENIKMALFFGLSFDFDAINRIKTLISPGK